MPRIARILLALSWPLSALAVLEQDARAVPTSGAQGTNDEKSIVSSDAEDALETHTFSLPDTRLARALFDSAQGHVAARRWSEAISDLQKILDEHRGDVLAAERPATPEGRLSEESVYPGAALRARRALENLPVEGRKLYRDRYEIEATEALDTARARDDRRALAEIGRRFPLTRAGERAFWALGDLELELGHEREALYAWSRALELRTNAPTQDLVSEADWKAARARLATENDDANEVAGATRRIDYAIQHLSARAAGKNRAENAGSLRLPAGGEANGPTPSPEGDSWPQAFTLASHPWTNVGRPDALQAVRSGDTLFVSTSLRLYAFQAYTGEILFDSGEPPGWSDRGDREREELFKGVDRESALVAAATSENVVVAALQLPYANLRADTYNGIPITTPIPERRLFAYDVASGRPLWNHSPPAHWDGESGGFTDRMSIAGPPVIVGSRVLAPCVRMQGRIDYQVGCFDVDTGALLWSTDVISGQRELNMFGRAEHEFSAAPLRVEGDKIVCQTQLGTVACLDLFSGEVLWQTLYSTIPMPHTRSFSATVRPTVWKNCAPVVQDGVVIATPTDSEDLLAIDLETGGLLWTQAHRVVNQLAGRDFAGVDLLLGTGPDVVYLGGDRFVALSLPAGLRQRQPLKSKWFFKDDTVARTRFGRPVLGKDRIVVPCFEGRVEIGREDGRRLDEVPWPSGKMGGNLLLGTGEMFAVSSRQVQGMFEWSVLVDRARADLARSPQDAGFVLELARLLDGRGTNEWSQGKTEAARVHFAEARSVLERALAGPADESKLALTAELHSALRGEARVRAALADSDGALASLRSARANAPDASALRDTLLEEIAILRERVVSRPTERAAIDACLDELERSCAALTLYCDARMPESGETLPLGARYVPVVGSHSQDEAVPFEMPVGLWVMLERAALHESRAAVALELVDLQAILATWPEVELPQGTAADVAGERIGALVRTARKEETAEYEARAQKALDDGTNARDGAALARVAKLFPYSQAARRANDARLDLSLDAGDVPTVARIVDSELPEPWRVEDATEREVRLVLRLASALGRTGNREAEAALLRSLAATHPDVSSDVAHQNGALLSVLAKNAPTFAEASRVPEPGHFAREIAGVLDHRPGDFEFLGVPAPSVPVQDIPAGLPRELLFAENFKDSSRQSATIGAFTSTDPTGPRFAVELPAMSLPQSTGSGSYWSRRVAFAAGRMLLATNEGVVAIDLDKGEIAWQWQPGGGAPDSMSIACSSGVAVVAVTPRGDRDRWFVQALDAHSGYELWRDGMQEAPVQRLPLLSDSRVVFLPTASHTQIVVRDLFTGTRSLRFDLESTAASGIDTDAWIDGDLLIVPWFTELRLQERNHVIAVDLATGKRRWRVPFGEDPNSKRWLAGVLQQDDRTWLLVQSRSDERDRLPEQSLLALDTKIGAITPLASLRIGAEDKILGLPRAARVRFASGPLMALAPRTGAGKGPARDARLRCLDLDRGELWAQSLNVAFDEIATSVLSQPALSDSSVAIHLTTNETKGRPGSWQSALLTFDRRTGLSGGRRDLRKSDKNDNPQLYPIGDTLLVRTKTALEILR